MRSILYSLVLAIGALTSTPAAATHWSANEIAILRKWVAAAPAEGLPPPSTKALDRALTTGTGEDATDDAASSVALELARMHLLGAATSAERAGWNIKDTDKDIDLSALLDRAILQGTLDWFFSGLRPTHPDYENLRRALASETDADRRTAIARNMERWRWMPRSLGPDFLIVNAPAFEAKLWRNGKPAGTWRVIVGKKSTPTPVFNATVTGVNLNPWWYVPDSIVRESVGALVRRSPATAAARGYVWSDGVYRQKPGPNNALGEMKLVMPNPYKVYLHDTPSKALFDEDVRAFSHGCIRVADALGLASTLLEGRMTREEIDAVVETRKTTTVNLAQELPIYITYFTAFADAAGTVRIVPDIYRRDGRIRSHAQAPSSARKVTSADGEGCPAPA